MAGSGLTLSLMLMLGDDGVRWRFPGRCCQAKTSARRGVSCDITVHRLDLWCGSSRATGSKAAAQEPMGMIGVHSAMPFHIAVSFGGEASQKRKPPFWAAFFFEACSTFTRVTARTLAESLNDPFHRKLQTG